MYRTELAIAKAKGNIAVMDVAQIPFSKGFDLEKLFYYMESMGVMFINSAGEEQDPEKRPNYNQFTTLDMTLANQIQNYVMLLDKLETMLESITGIYRQSLGNTSQYETASGVERSVQQTSYITEPMFYLHSEAVKRACMSLLECSTLAWENKDKLSYVTDDMGVVSIKLENKTYSLSEFDMFVVNDNKYKRLKEFLESNAMNMIQNGTPVSTVFSVLETSSIGHKKELLKIAEETMQALQQEQAQADRETQKEIEMMRSQIQEMTLQLQEANNIRDNETKITVAQIAAGSVKNTEDEDYLKAEKLMIDNENKKEELEFKHKELSEKIKLENKKIESNEKIKHLELKTRKNNLSK
jgi:hypothetical protein